MLNRQTCKAKPLTAKGVIKSVKFADVIRACPVRGKEERFETEDKRRVRASGISLAFYSTRVKKFDSSQFELSCEST